MGQLSPKQAADGIRASMENARELVAEAQLLIDAGHFARGASLAILAIEEAGKAPILRQLVAADSPAALRELWRAFRTHTAKNAMAPFFEVAGSLATNGKKRVEDFRIDDFSPLYDQGGDHPQLFDSIKQLGFYSDCLGRAHWSRPSEVVDKNLAHSILSTASLLSHRALTVDSEAGLELWRRHFKGVAPRDLRRALVQFYGEAEAMGIVEAGQADRMRTFTGLAQLKKPRSS